MKRKLKKRLRQLEQRVARLEHGDLPDAIDVSGDPVSGVGLWREACTDYTSAWDEGEDWRYL